MTIRETIEDAIRFEEYKGNFIAQTLDIPQPTLSRFLGGTRGIQFDYFERLCDFLQLRLARTIDDFDAYFSARWKDGGPELARLKLEDEKTVQWEQYLEENWEPEECEFEEYVAAQWKKHAQKAWPEHAEDNNIDILDCDEGEHWKSQEYPGWREDLYEEWEENGKNDWVESEYEQWSNAFDERLEDEQYLLNWFKETLLEDLQSQSWIHIKSCKNE